jgi:predicted nucleotidyltransferase
MNPAEQIREHITELRDRYQVASLGIFGSFARGEATESSDVDILVEFSESVDIFHFIRLQYYLAEILGRKVDMVTPDALKPLIKDRILREVLYV